MKQQSFWFPAKRYGWGWGLPVNRKGWVAFAIYIACMAGTAYVNPPSLGLYIFLGWTFGFSIAFIGICFLKFEPPAWRWGE